MKTDLERATATLDLVAKLRKTADECDKLNRDLQTRIHARRAQRQIKPRFTALEHDQSEKPSETVRTTTAQSQKPFVSRVIWGRCVRRLGVDENSMTDIILEEKRMRELYIESQGTGSVAQQAARQLSRSEDLSQARLTDLAQRGGIQSRRRAMRVISSVQQNSEFNDELWRDRAAHVSVARPKLGL